MKYFDFSRLRGFFDKIRLKLFYNTVYYVNSPQTLPPPLKKAEEEKYIAEFMNGSDRAREKLIVHNLRLVVYIAKKFENSGVNIEDLVSIGTIGLIKSVNTFRPDKNIKLATYSSRCIENEILMHLRKVNQQKSDISLDEPLNVDWDGNELLLSDVLGSAFRARKAYYEYALRFGRAKRAHAKRGCGYSRNISKLYIAA